MTGQGAEIVWRDGGTPVSRRFDDPYYSQDDGLAETRHVFLAGNGLPGRFRDGFAIAELGFGTGLNLLAAWAEWRRAGVPGRLRFASFEAYPLGPGDLAAALRPFPELADLALQLQATWARGETRVLADDLEATVILGDVAKTLPRWAGLADAWFLDGFAPAKNPGMWAPDVLAEVARHTAPGGTFATYTAAGHVRRALSAAGFEVERTPGYGRKRHMSSGRLARR